jgi:cysteine desulfurase
VHRAGANARARLEAAREEVAAVIGAHPLEVVFTSGATEANNLALGGVAAAAGRFLRMAIPATEHSSVLQPARALACQGHELRELPVSAGGVTDAEAVADSAPDLLSVALVNAETGVLQPAAALVAAARRVGAIVHLDAAQAAAVLPLDVRALDCDLLTLSGHKLGGPFGSGALYVRLGTALASLQHGGPQEQGLRPGTENVPALAGFAAAFTAAHATLAVEVPRLGVLTERLRAGIATIDPNARVTGESAVHDGGAAGFPARPVSVAPRRDLRCSAVRAPHILNVTFPGVVGESLVAALDLEGIAVSAGSACAAGASEPSHVLLAMGRDREAAASALRFSVGWASTTADVDAVLAVLPAVLARARRRREEAAWPAHAS